MPLARALLALVLVSLVLSLAIPANAQTADEVDLPNGRFYTQARGSAPAGTGFAVTNDGDIPFWTWFQRYGGVSQVGYPVSHRFQWKGFTSQAFQKVVFQWRPDQGNSVQFVNVFDELKAANKDDWLAVARDVPNSLKWEEDSGKPWDQVVKNHYALLDRDPAIKDLFLSAGDPIAFNGLPMAYEEMRNVAVLRAQRKVFQRWKIDVPWARAGQVLVANGGDVGKEAGLYPAAAIEPKRQNEIPAIVQASSPTPVPTNTPAPHPTNTPVPTNTVGPSPTPGAPKGPTPNPLVGACDNIEQKVDRSMLRNGMFDGDFPGGVPTDWKNFVSKGNVFFTGERGIEKFGAGSWKIGGTGEFVGGGYQIMSGLRSGRWYQAFYATAQQVWGNGRKDGSLPILREVGLDPTGGTNPDAPTVIWGRTAGGQRDKDLNKYGGWKTLTNENNPLVSVIAVGDKMTVFLRVKSWPDTERGDAWLDSVFFFEACEPGYR